ncbi:MAG: hypothetical protein KTR13_06665 [Saprospiraceae bacterium]|nr:hypothetical protein [Saprospiraceae bacterium]
MFKFFQKARQQLLKENKFTKYLFYAIGEILLVVIGILIALGVNNLSQRKALKNKEKTYLEGLKQEFIVSKEKLLELLEVNEESYQSAKEILELIHDDSNFEEKRLSNLLFMAYGRDLTYNPNVSLLQEMISSGSIKDISNADLRLQLTNWLPRIQDIKRQEEELTLQREKSIDLMRSGDYSIKTIFDQAGISEVFDLPTEGRQVKSNRAILSSREFENNTLTFFLTAHIIENSHYQPLLDNVEQTLSLIDEELE